MCHSRDFRAFGFRKEAKPEQTPAAVDRRSEVIGTLLSGANKRAEEKRPERAPVKEAVPAK